MASLYVETSPSSRSACHICGNTIEKGEKRVYTHLGRGFYPAYFHASCFKKKFGKEMRKILS
jgi:hypothetical protein